MSGQDARWNAYWFREAPLVDLAAVRWIAVGFQLARMMSGTLESALAATAIRPVADFRPVLVVQLLGAGARPTMETLATLHALTVLAGALALVGLACRASLALFALGVVYLEAYACSFGRFHHDEPLLALALLALAASPAGGALSIDRLLARVRRGAASLPATSCFARWPLLFVRWIVALAFLSAAGSKLGRSGLEWMNGYTLQYCAFVKGAKLDTPLGVWFSTRHELCRVVSWMVVLFESSFFLVLFERRLVRIYVPLAAVLVLAWHLTLGARFYQLLALLSAFVPWQRLVALAVEKARPSQAEGPQRGH